jgi:hypothetical protein
MTDKVTELYKTHVGEAIKNLEEMKHEVTTLAIVAVREDGSVYSGFAHNGDPDPYRLLGAMVENQHTVLNWLDGD